MQSVRVFSLLAVLAAASIVALPAQTATIPHALTMMSGGGAALRQWNSWLQSHERSGELRVRERSDDFMLTGREHERLEQFHGGVRVFGAGVSRQWRDGQVESVFGRVYDDLTLSTQPSIGSGEATRRFGCAHTLGAPELTVFMRADQPVLTWRVVCSQNGDVAQTFLDAHSSRLVHRITSIKTQSAVGDGRGVYLDRKKFSGTRQGSVFTADDALRPPQLLTLDLRGNLNRAKALLEGVDAIRPSDVASDIDNVWDDGAVVDAHAYIGFTYDYLFRRFGRRGLDDRNSPMLTIVHPVTQAGALELNQDDFSLFAVNAFWCGECGPNGAGMMVFGDGIPPEYYLEGPGQSVNFLAASLDVAAHELAHGVTDKSSGLIYENESGALNEAFSDIIGTGAEFMFQPPGAAIGQADYKIAEDSFRAVVPGFGDGIRSMAVPTAYGDPDHYSIRYTGPEDGGGVHINSAIANHAFYLAVEGGTHRLSGITVPGVGPQSREQIERAFFRAFTMLLPPNATFAVARAATIQAARDLYGAGSPAERAITTAWTAVGVQ